MMGERERLKQMLKKVIDDTENDKIKTSDELIQTLIYELTNISPNRNMPNKQTIQSQSMVN